MMNNNYRIYAGPFGGCILFGYFVFSGFRKAIQKLWPLILLAGIWTYGTVVMVCPTILAGENLNPLSLLAGKITSILIVISIIFGSVCFLAYYGLPVHYYRINEGLTKIGFTNRNGELPTYLSAKSSNGIVTYLFQENGISVQKWKDRQDDIESVLNVRILDIKYYGGLRYIKIRAVDGDHAIPDYCEWSDDLIMSDDFSLVLGQNYQVLTADLNSTPHILIAGSTGSGKTVLLKNLIYQCVKKQARVYLADFKGLVDFSAPFWGTHCKLIGSAEDLIIILTDLVNQMEDRLLLLYEQNCKDISDYNLYYPEQPMQRMILAIDELAELIDKTGSSKEQKALITEIDSKIRTIARKGRAAGVHLIAATQRPDAELLSGQIRNNFGIKICGRADLNLSELVLGNGEAYRKVDFDIRGRFIKQDGEVFQGYYWSDRDLR